MSKTLVTIIVEGLGKQEIYLTNEDAVKIYANASQNIVDKLLSVDKDKHECSCGSCHNSEDVDGRLAFVVGEKPPDKGPIHIFEGVPIDSNTTKKLMDESLTTFPVPNSTINLEEKHEDLPFYDCEANPFAGNEFFKNKKLVVYRCMDCGQVTARNVVLADSNITSCHWCKEPVEITEAVLAEIQCGSCDKNHAFIYVANGLSEMNCRNCEAPIDISYYQDGTRKKAKSANLL